jgi:hypothetical protein
MVLVRACPNFGPDPISQAARDAAIFLSHQRERRRSLRWGGIGSPDIDAAREEAIEGIRQIISDAVLTGSPLGLDREMHVDDDAGHTLLKIIFREVVDISVGN